MKIFIYLSIFFISGFSNFIFATIGEYGRSSTYSCYPSSGNKCWISDDAYYDNHAAFAITQSNDLISIPDIPNTQELTYFYIPNIDNKYSGKGVIDGLLIYNPNSSNIIFYTFTDDNSLIFDNYSSWAAALIQRGIIVPPLE